MFIDLSDLTVNDNKNILENIGPSPTNASHLVIESLPSTSSQQTQHQPNQLQNSSSSSVVQNIEQDIQSQEHSNTVTIDISTARIIIEEINLEDENVINFIQLLVLSMF